VYVRGERSIGSFEVQIRAEPAPREEDIEVAYANDALTLRISRPF
jgi:hypothetical protein